MDWLTEFLQNMGGSGGSPVLPGPTGGEAAPMGVPDSPYQTPNSLGAALAPSSSTSNILAGLKGVQAMGNPDVVKPSTPAAPQRSPIQSGEFLALLQSLSQPRQPMRPQQTLSQAIGTGRY